MQNGQKSRPVTTIISLGDIRALGIRFISAVLRERGWTSNVVIFKQGYSKTDIPTEREENILIGLLKDLKTDIAGLSVKTPFLNIAEKLTKRIQDEVGSLVVWGGSHPTLSPEDSLKSADIACVGESEYTFLELVEQIAEGESIDGIRNLFYKKDGKIIRNSIRPLLQTKDLDALPFADYGGENKYVINKERLIRKEPLDSVIEYYPMASRGCPYKCSFCINGVLRDIYYGKGSFVRVRSPEKVVDEIVDVLNIFPQVRRIRFQDEVFPWKRDWIERFSEEYRKRVGLPFLCTFHPNTTDEENVKTLKAAGLIVVGFGMQSPAEWVRREVFHRPETNETILKSIEILHKNKLEGFYDVILDNPFETEEDKKQGLNFLLKIPKPFNIAPFSLKFFPGYKITKEALGKGVVDESEVKKISSQGYFEMDYKWYYPRNKDDLFWNCLYLLSCRSIFPGSLVKYMSRSGFLKKHPSSFILLTKLTWYPEIAVVGIRRVFRRQTNVLNFIKVMKAKLLRQTV